MRIFAALIALLLISATDVGAAEVWRVTAYDACKKCCGKTDGITASGRKAVVGRTVACNWLPFGTRLRIDGRIFIVEDRGAKSLFGSKTNNIRHVDVFMDSHKLALAFGSQYLTVEIL